MNHLRYHFSEQSSDEFRSIRGTVTSEADCLPREIQVKSAFGKGVEGKFYGEVCIWKYITGFCYSSHVIMGSRCDEEVAVRSCLRISQ